MVSRISLDELVLRGGVLQTVSFLVDFGDRSRYPDRGLLKYMELTRLSDWWTMGRGVGGGPLASWTSATISRILACIAAKEDRQENGHDATKAGVAPPRRSSIPRHRTWNRRTALPEVINVRKDLVAERL